MQVVRSCKDMSDLLRSVSNLVYRILCNRQLPLELRANSGHIWVLVERLDSEDRVVEIVRELVRRGETEDGRFSCDNSGAVLSLLHGVVSSGDRDWMVGQSGLLSDIISVISRVGFSMLLCIHISMYRCASSTGRALASQRLRD